MRTVDPPLATLAGSAAPIAGVAPIRVAIVDDCPDVRFLLATIIELDGRFEVVAEASDADSALASVAATEPDLVLVDLRLGADSGTSVIRDLRQRGATACIVVLTASAAPHDHAAALDAGADAIRSKCSMTSTLVDDLAQLVARYASGTLADINVHPNDCAFLGSVRQWVDSGRSRAETEGGRPSRHAAATITR